MTVELEKQWPTDRHVQFRRCSESIRSRRKDDMEKNYYYVDKQVPDWSAMHLVILSDVNYAVRQTSVAQLVQQNRLSRTFRFGEHF